MDHSNIFKPKMFDSRQKEKAGEEKSHQLHTPEKSQQPGYTCRTKCHSAKKKVVPDVPDGIPLKPVFHKRALDPRPGHTEARERLIHGATGGHRSRDSRGDSERLPGEQRRLAQAIHDKELLIEEKLLRTAQSMRKIILQDREPSTTWRREPGRRRDGDMGTEGRVVMELNSDKERSKRSIHSSAKMRGEYQWSQAGANDKEEEKHRWERDSMGRYGSGGKEKEQVGQKQSVYGRSAERRGGKERSHLLRSGRPQAEDPIPEERTEASLQLLSCKYCDRRFASDRLEKHLTICERLHQHRRTAYDSSKHRIQGTDMEKLRQHSGTGVSSEVKKSTGGQKQAANRNMHQVGPDQVTCPHCSRRFAPRAAERHIPKCEHIRSRPPPPRHRQ